MADLGEGPGARDPLLFGVKKEEMTEGRKAGWASKLKPGPLLRSKSASAIGTFGFFLTFGLNLSLVLYQWHYFYFLI